MKITVNRTELAAAVTYVKRALPRRPVVPVLAGMRLEVADGRLSLAAFDYETAARAFVNGDSAESGVILVTGAELADAVKVLPKGKTVRAELTVTTPEPLPEPTETHDYSETPDDQYPHLVYAQCSCGEWRTSGASAPYITRAKHQSHAPALIVQPMPTLTVECEGTVSRLTGLDMSEYPELPAMPAHAGTIAAESFARSFTRVAAAAGTDDTLPVLTCVLLEMGPSSLTMAATDRYRLAVDSAGWTAADLEGEYAAAVPARIVAEFIKAAKGAGKVSIHAAADAVPESERGYRGLSGFAGFTTDDRQLIVRTYDVSNFPKYRGLLPETCETAVRVDSAALQAAVKRAGARLGRNEAVRLEVAGDDVAVRAYADGAVVSDQSVSLAFREGPALQAAFNPAYLVSMLAGVTGEATLRFTGTKPLQVTGEGDPFRGLLMPIRIAS